MPWEGHASAQPRYIHPLFFTAVYVTKYCNSYTWTGDMYSKNVTINWDITQHVQQRQCTTYQLLCNRKNNISKDSGTVLSSIKNYSIVIDFLQFKSVISSHTFSNNMPQLPNYRAKHFNFYFQSKQVNVSYSQMKSV